MDEIVSALIANGPLGAALAAVGFAYWRQAGELRDVQAARVEDAKKTVTTLLDLVDKQHEASGEVVRAVGELKAAIERRRLG